MGAIMMRSMAVLAAATAGCSSLDVVDLNSPGLETLQDNPTPTVVNTAATGLIVGARVGVATPNGWVVGTGILGREGYNLNSSSDPRYVTEMVQGPLQPGSTAFGSNFWTAFYRNIRNANVLIAAVDRTTGLSDAEKNGIRGFARTMLAHDLHRVILSRDDNGAVIDVPDDPTAPPGPIVSKAQTYTRIVELLDQANTELGNAGTSFSFPLGAGFAGFATPASFRTVNRALRARVAVYSDDYAGALAALGASFLSTGASLATGVYFTFSAASGDLTNALFDPAGNARLVANPTLVTSAQQRSDGSPDLRVSTKIQVGPAQSTLGISSNLQFTLYNSIAAPVPIIRNEELILLRAEANLGLGNIPAALADIDYIRTTAGGLPAYGGPQTPAAVLDELLYNKRYSLLWEGGFSWFDYRHYGKLTELPRGNASGKFFTRMPFPVNECLPRDGSGASLSGCNPTPGI